MARDESGRDIDEERRVLIHASSLNRADVIKKVLLRDSQGSVPQAGGSGSPPRSTSGVVDAEVDRNVLDHVDEKGLTALHYAVRKSSLDAIRVLLRLGVDVTVRGGPDSAFPNLTACEVALSGGCKGNPEEVKQVFLTEAVQAIAQGNEERLSAFFEAGLGASSEYGGAGTDGESEGQKMSLAKWAEQFGRAEMFSDLSKRAQGRNNEAFPSEGNGDGDGGNQGMEALVEREDGERRGLDEGGRPLDARNGGTAATDHAGMFVEELREVIVGLTAECEQLEAVLSPRGMLGIVRRARSALEELMSAEREVETAKALCKRWRTEEHVAVAENARLQAAVVEAQAAVHRQRTGAAENAQPLGTPNAGSSRDDPEGDVKQPLNASTCNDHEGRKVEGGVAGGEDGNGASRREGDGETLLESRKREEAEALSSQLQLIAAYMEDEIQIMRALESGSGVGGVLLRIRGLRERVEAAHEEARQTFSVSRYLEARVVILTDNGNELRSQLERLEGYLRQPEGALNESAAFARKGATPPGKEDVDASPAPVEHSYRGPKLDACLDSDGEGDPPVVAAGVKCRGDDAKGQCTPAAAAAPAPAPAAPVAAATPFGIPLTERGEADGGAGENDDAVSSGRVASANDPLPSVNETETVRRSAAVEATVAEKAGETSEKDKTPSASASETKGGVTREGRARALLLAPGVDAEDGVRGWRRPRRGVAVDGSGGRSGEDEHEQPPKVTVMQDVMSALFGWRVSAGARRGGGEISGIGGDSNAARIMFA